MPKHIYNLSIIVDVVNESKDEGVAALNLESLFDPENLDVSEIGNKSSAIVHEVTEPDAHGRSIFAQLCYTIAVEASSEDEALNAVDEFIAFYADGWEVDQIAIRSISS
jgi:hypothetical protein